MLIKKHDDLVKPHYAVECLHNSKDGWFDASGPYTLHSRKEARKQVSFLNNYFKSYTDLGLKFRIVRVKTTRSVVK